MAEGKTKSEESSYASVQARRQLEDAERFLQTGNLVAAQDTCRELLAEHADIDPSHFEAALLYLDLMKRCLTDSIFIDDPLAAFVPYRTKARTNTLK